MAKYATGKYAKAISDRSGMEFPYKEMVREWNGSFVHVSEFEPKQPQLEPKPMNGDSISLRNVRPDRTETAVPNLLPLNAFTTTNGSATISVNEPDHGRSTGNTVRFRDASVVGGVAADISQSIWTLLIITFSSISFIIDNAVNDFPHPDSPTKPIISPLFIWIETSLIMSFLFIEIQRLSIFNKFLVLVFISNVYI